MVIREIAAGDEAAAFLVETAAFAREDEARIVNRLRAQNVPLIEWVAEIDAELIGHALFSPVTVQNGTAVCEAMALGPIGVLPPWQGQGIGSRLIRAGLKSCREAGHEIVFVLGHPEYYPRFGFETASDYGLRCEFNPPPVAFMVQALRPGALNGVHGVVYYHPAFRGE